MPPGRGGTRGAPPPARDAESGPRTAAPPRRPPTPQPAAAPSAGRGAPSSGRGAPTGRAPRPTGALQGPAPPATQTRPAPQHEESSLEHHLEAALETLRPSRAVTAFKKASALTRWIILIFIVGLGAAAAVGLALLALFTLVDSSV